MDNPSDRNDNPTLPAPQFKYDESRRGKNLNQPQSRRQRRNSPYRRSATSTESNNGSRRMGYAESKKWNDRSASNVFWITTWFGAFISVLTGIITAMVMAGSHRPRIPFVGHTTFMEDHPNFPLITVSLAVAIIIWLMFIIGAAIQAIKAKRRERLKRQIPGLIK